LFKKSSRTYLKILQGMSLSIRFEKIVTVTRPFCACDGCNLFLKGHYLYELNVKKFIFSVVVE